MNFIRFNRPSQGHALTNMLDDLFSKSIGDIVNDFSNKPSVNIIETDDAFNLELAAPGLSKSDFGIQIIKDQLIIEVIKKADSDDVAENTTQYRRREFDYTGFKRTFHLHKTINTEAVDAKYENGVLLVTLGKKEEAKEKEPKTISIS